MRELSIAMSLMVVCCEAKNDDELEEAKQLARQAQEQAEAVQRELSDLKAKTSAAPTSSATGAVPTASAVGSGDVVAPGAAKTEPGVYPLGVINAVAENCRSASVMLAAVPTNVAQKDDFAWSFAIQALYAHSQFKLTPRARLSAKGQVAFEDVAVNASATGLIAYCHDGATCSQLAAMYKATVPSSKPEVYCGKTWEAGQPSNGLTNELSLRAIAKKKLEDGASSMCARIGVCTKHQDPGTEGDPGVECQRAPTKYKYQCAKKDTCESVIECTKQ